MLFSVALGCVPSGRNLYQVVFSVSSVLFFLGGVFFRIQQGERGPRVDRKTSIEFTWPLLLLLYVVKISTRMQSSLEKAHQLG